MSSRCGAAGSAPQGLGSKVVQILLFYYIFYRPFRPEMRAVAPRRLGSKGLYRSPGRPAECLYYFTAAAAAAASALRHAVEVFVHFWIQGWNVKRMLFYLVSNGRENGREERKEVGDRLCSSLEAAV